MNNKKTLPPGVRLWQQYQNIPCEIKDVANCYSKNASALSNKMKRSNLDNTWPEHLRTERNMHYLMQTSSAAQHKDMLAKWMTEASKQTAKQQVQPVDKKVKENVNTKDAAIFKKIGYQAELEKLEILAAKASDDLRCMLEAGEDSKEIAAATQVYNSIVQSLHKFKKDSFGIYEDDGDFLHINEVIQTIIPILARMKTDLLSQCVIISSALSGIESTDLITRKLQKMVNGILKDTVKQVENVKTNSKK